MFYGLVDKNMRGFLLKTSLLLGTIALAPDLCAAAAKSSGLAGLADNITKNFTAVGKLFISTAYLAGLGFGVAAIFKFKQHKDNPTQIPVGTPFALLGVSVMLVFLPGLYQPLGQTIYGKDVTNKAGGFTGGGVSGIPGGDSK